MKSPRLSVHIVSFIRWTALCGLVVALSGCGREKITEYRIPKESDGAMAAAAQPQIHGRIPSGWKQQPASGMSVLSFAVAGSNGRNAELSVLSFPGAGAPTSALVNIVRENAGLKPLEDAELAKLMEPVEVAGGKGSLVDFTSAAMDSGTATSNRVLLTILERDGVTWFFKFAGESTLLAEQKPALLDFLKSISFTSGGGDALPREEHIASTNPKQTSPMGQGMAIPGAEAPAGSRPAWEVPSGWKEVPPTQMLLAKFVAGGQEGNADVTVSVAGGDVMGNVNRWRGQLGLPSINQEEVDKSLTSVDVLGGKAMLVDVTGKDSNTGKDARIVAAIWPRSGGNWFFKLMGDPAAAGREKDTFIRFIQSVRFPNG